MKFVKTLRICLATMKSAMIMQTTWLRCFAQTDDTECVIEAEDGELRIVKRADIYNDNGIAEI